jgi:DeoR/GlpR family transcriptional regulator of sugar metabolism
VIRCALLLAGLLSTIIHSSVNAQHNFRRQPGKEYVLCGGKYSVLI